MPTLENVGSLFIDAHEIEAVSSLSKREVGSLAVPSQRRHWNISMHLDLEDPFGSTRLDSLSKNSDAMVSPMSTPTTRTFLNIKSGSLLPGRKPSLLFGDSEPPSLNSPQKVTAKRTLSARALHDDNKENVLPCACEAPACPPVCSSAVQVAASANEVAGAARLHLAGLDEYLKQRHAASVSLKVAAENARAEATRELESVLHIDFESSRFAVVEQLHWTFIQPTTFTL